MIKQFYFLSPLLDNYESIGFDNQKIDSGLLYMLFLSFNKYRNWIIVEERDDKVYIWDSFDEDDYDNWEDIPKLIMSKQNYDYILGKIAKVVNQKPKYFILSYGDNGWIDLEIKDELSQDDLMHIDQEKCKRLSQNK
ncbi:hypothetical protein HYV11_01100 [Candidatus Dependentiae bacterium]|nr:hypothetical protein [Candidatus Dependentiae bacterium]